MEKNNKLLVGLLLLVGALVVVTGLLVANSVPECPSLKCPECKPVIHEVEKVVVEEVEVETDWKQSVVDKLMEELSSDKTLRKCEGVKYDVEEIAVKKVYSGFSVKENNEDEVSVSGVKVKLNYDNGKCYKTLTCGINSEEELVC